MRVLWEQDRRKFLRALADLDRHRERRRASMLVCYDTGCRVSELAALDVKDYDPVRHTLSLINCKAQGHPRREVPIHPRTSRALNTWLRVRPATENPALFVSQKGNRLSVRQLQDEYRAICEQAGIEAQGIHTLRHTAATRLLDDRILDGHQVARRLGHRSIQTTYAIYVHASPEAEAKAIRGAPL